MGRVAVMAEMLNTYEVPVEKPVGERLLGRHGHRWRMMVLQWILEHSRCRWQAAANMATNIRVPYKAENLTS